MTEHNPLLWILLSIGVTATVWALAVLLDRLYFIPYLARSDREEDFGG